MAAFPQGRGVRPTHAFSIGPAALQANAAFQARDIALIERAQRLHHQAAEDGLFFVHMR
ncbi:hypothetical protein D3C71_2229990 [compost metagenome]